MSAGEAERKTEDVHEAADLGMSSVRASSDCADRAIIDSSRRYRLNEV